VAEKVLARAAPAASRWLFASSAAMNRPPMKTACSLRAAPKKPR
jgi:hypothetical protein